MYEALKKILNLQIEDIKNSGLYKDERLIQGPQGPQIEVNSEEVINFCANNYLGLSNDPRLVKAAQEGFTMCNKRQILTGLTLGVGLTHDIKLVK